jgi:hypothetical protein
MFFEYLSCGALVALRCLESRMTHRNGRCIGRCTAKVSFRGHSVKLGGLISA